MMQLNGQHLSVNEIFWHLYLEPNKAYSLSFLGDAAQLVFKSIETNGLNGVYPIADGYCESMPCELTDDAIDDLAYILSEEAAESELNELRIVIKKWVQIAHQLASLEKEYKQPIKAFVILPRHPMVLIRQGYVDENCLDIQDDLVEAGYFRPGWQDFTRWDTKRVNEIKKALVKAIADNFFGDTSIKVS